MPPRRRGRSGRANPAPRGRGQGVRGRGRGGLMGTNPVVPYMGTRNRTDISSSWMPIFKAAVTCKLRYSSSFYSAGASGVVATNVLAANGLYDPDITGSGHQPMGFDPLMIFFNHYTVTSCLLTVTFKNYIANTPTISIRVDGGSTPITVVDQIVEMGLNTHSTLEYKGVSGSCKVLQCLVNIKRFEGVKDVMDVIELRGSVAANPTELTYFHVQTWDNAGATNNVLCEVIMEFSARFTEPRTITASLAQMEIYADKARRRAILDSSSEEKCDFETVVKNVTMMLQRGTAYPPHTAGRGTE